MGSCEIAPAGAPGMAQLRQLGCDAFVEIGPQPVLVKHLGWPIWDPSNLWLLFNWENGEKPVDGSWVAYL